MNILYIYERFVIPISITLLPLIGIGVIYMKTILKGAYARAGFSLIFSVALFYQFFTGYLPITYLQVKDTKRQLSATIGDYVSPGTTLLWNDGRIADLPNATVYTNYHLIMPENEEVPLRSVEHILFPYDENVHCLLSTSLLDPQKYKLSLIESWEYPNWVLAHVMDHVPAEYYLYDIDGECLSQE